MYVSKDVKDVSSGCYLDALSPYDRNEEGFLYAVVSVEWLNARNSVTTILGYYPTKERALSVKKQLMHEMYHNPEFYSEIVMRIEVWHLTDDEKSGE